MASILFLVGISRGTRRGTALWLDGNESDLTGLAADGLGFTSLRDVEDNFMCTKNIHLSGERLQLNGKKLHLSGKPCTGEERDATRCSHGQRVLDT